MKMSKLKRAVCAVATFGALMASGAAHAELKAFYTFEDSLNDLSGNGYTGSSANGAGYAAGHEGQALDLDDALNQYVSVSGLDINPSSMPAITFGAWVNAGAESAVRGVLSHDDG